MMVRTTYNIRFGIGIFGAQMALIWLDDRIIGRKAERYRRGVLGVAGESKSQIMFIKKRRKHARQQNAVSCTHGRGTVGNITETGGTRYQPGRRAASAGKKLSLGLLTAYAASRVNASLRLSCFVEKSVECPCHMLMFSRPSNDDRFGFDDLTKPRPTPYERHFACCLPDEAV